MIVILLEHALKNELSCKWNIGGRINLMQPGPFLKYFIFKRPHGLNEVLYPAKVWLEKNKNDSI